MVVVVVVVVVVIVVVMYSLLARVSPVERQCQRQCEQLTWQELTCLSPEESAEFTATYTQVYSQKVVT